MNMRLILLSILILESGAITLSAKHHNRAAAQRPNTFQPTVEQNTSNNLSQTNNDQQEGCNLMQQIAAINEYYTAMGASRSSARIGHITQYLQTVGTPTALKLLADLKQNGSI